MELSLRLRTTARSGWQQLEVRQLQQLRVLTTRDGQDLKYDAWSGSVDEYSVWSGMIQRCTNPNSEAYDNYAGRGIFVCDRWMSFENFYADMGPRPSPMHSLDRIINDQGYNPENCRWATRVVQNNNTRSNRLIEYKGQMYTLSQLSQLPQVLANGISYNTLLNRLTAQGMDVETAITQPVRRKRND